MAYSTFQSDWLCCCCLCIDECYTQSSPSFLESAFHWVLFLTKSLLFHFINTDSGIRCWVKTCYPKGVENIQLISPLLSSLKKAFAFAISKKISQTQCPPPTSYISLYPSTWLPLILYGFFCSLIVNWLLVSTIDLWLTLFIFFLF